jgi:hypothetical protein
MKVLSKPNIEELLQFMAAATEPGQSVGTTPSHGFNVFSALRLERDEVRLHNRLIAVLIDPSASHGSGARFLKAFLRIADIRLGNPDACEVRLERRLGSNGCQGRADILLIEGGRTRVCIENKIHAAEQDGQIARYQRECPDAVIIFITPSGRRPKTEDVVSSSRIVCLSYRQHVYDWIRECVETSKDAPGLQEVLSQYLGVIRSVTGRRGCTPMDKQLIDAIGTKGSRLEALRDLSDLQDDVWEGFNRRLEAVATAAAKQHGLERHDGEGDWHRADRVLGFTNCDLKRLGLVVGMEFETQGYRNCFFGFRWSNLRATDRLAPMSFRSRLLEEMRSRWRLAEANDAWVGWAHWEEHKDWGELEFEGVVSGSMMGLLGERFGLLMEAFDESMGSASMC